MNIRAAILKAADRIERNPKCYKFTQAYDARNGRGCALVWIGYEAGFTTGTRPYAAEVATVLLGLRAPVDNLTGYVGAQSEIEFFRRMDTAGLEGWMVDALACANALRAYADKYHPAQSIPDSVRAIFRIPQEIVA